MWEGHKIWKNLTTFFFKLLGTSKQSGRFIQIFVAISGHLNLSEITFTKSSEARISYRKWSRKCNVPKSLMRKVRTSGMLAEKSTKFQLIWNTFIPLRKMSPECLSEWAEIFQVFTKSEIKQMLKILAFYLNKQKSFIPKKIWSVPCTMDNSFFSQQMPYCLATLLVYNYGTDQSKQESN